jgi:YD repeat-containing protein
MKRVSLSLLLCSIFALSCFSQVTPGIQTFSAYNSHEIDTVNLMSNDIILSVPVISKPGLLPFTYNLAGSFFVVKNGTTWASATGLTWVIDDLLNTIVTAKYSTSTQTLCPNGITRTIEYTNWYLVTSDGAHHPLSYGDYTDSMGCLNASFDDQPLDRSHYIVHAHLGGGSVYATSGTALGYFAMTDSNGNQINGSGPTSPTTWTDAMGLRVLTSTSSTTGDPTESWTNVNGGTNYLTPTNQPATTLATNFGCNGVSEEAAVWYPLTQLGYDDGTQVLLSYEATPGTPNSYTGRISTIRQREGGTISYTYGGAHNGIDCTYQTVPTLTRTLGNGDVTTYTLTHPQIGTSANYQAVNTMVDPGGNKTVYTFTGFTSTGNSPNYGQVLTEVQRYQGTSTPLSTDIYCYNTSFTSCSTSTAPTAQVTLPISTQIVFHQLAGASNWSATETDFDSYGNVTYSAQYDFGGSSPVRATTVVYGTCTAGCNTAAPTISSIGSHINDRPGKIVVNQNGNLVAQRNLVYDTHGNLVTTYAWTGTTWLSNTTANIYNSNGTPSETFDFANNETDYSYLAGSYIGCSSCTQFPFPTQVKNKGTGDYINTTWYGVGGMRSTDTDRDGNTTTYCYNTGANCTGGTADPFWRVLQTIDPLGNTVVLNYPNASAPDSAGSSFTFNSGNSIESTNLTVDGYGRMVNLQQKQGPGATTYDTVSTSYGWNGNYLVVSTSQPCSTTLASSCPAVHLYDYDPLGRLYTESTTSNETITHTYSNNNDLAVLSPAPTGENNKQTEMVYDGLGRVTNICYIGAGNGTACTNDSGHSGLNEARSYTAASGSRTVTVTRGSQTRSTTFDGLGRMISKTTPEGGTWTYNYDTPTTACTNSTWNPNMPGNLVQSLDPNGNTLCYYHYVDGSLATVWPSSVGAGNKAFAYNGTVGMWGQNPPGGAGTVHNTAGRLVEAETDDGAWPRTQADLITDEWFSYDKDGRITDMWECTPHSGAGGCASSSYLHSVATFYDNGAVASLQLASPSLYTMSFGLDGEGRLNTVTDTTHSKSFVTGATYFPAANPDVTTIAPNDKDSFTYDSNTGKMTQYKFTVNSVDMTGALTWNANGTLNKLAITDGFNSGGTQTCLYNPASGQGYDDWGRLLQIDCGTGSWGQTFSYDNYDNLTKTKMANRNGTTWNPGYSSTTNHYATGSTYDSNGNVTGDGNFAYGWDSFSKLKWATTSGTPNCTTTGHCITYDAFGRIVETSNGSTFRERWITQLGETAQMTGTTINFAYFPAPHGGIALENGNNSTTQFMHPDWQHNVRVASTLSHVVSFDQAFTPYGETFSIFGTVSSQGNVFADMKENFYTGAMWDTPNRELSSAPSRWLSPDPAGAGWNQYAYSTNPNSETDPSGLADCRLGGDGCPTQGGGVQFRCDPSDVSCGAFAIAGLIPPDYPYGAVAWIWNCSFGTVLVPAGCGGGGSQASDGGGSSQASSHAANNCVTPSKVQSAVIPVAAIAAKFWNKTVLWGVGGSGGIGFGKGIGIYGTASVQIAVSPNGNAAYVITFASPAIVSGTGTYMWVTPSTKGAGILGGSQFGFSNATDSSQLAGSGVDASGSLAAGLGIGVDSSVSIGGNLPYTFNVTLGFGAGGRGSAGAATNTTVVPICHN